MISPKQIKDQAEMDRLRMEGKAKMENAPIPEALTGTPWTIVEATRGGCVNPEKSVMGVPLTPDDYARAIRDHEMYHVKWSPKKIPRVKDVKPATILSVEDAKIQALGAARFRRLPYLGEKFGEMSRAYKKGELSVADLMRYCIAGLFTGDKSDPAMKGMIRLQKEAMKEGDVERSDYLQDAIKAVRGIEQIIVQWAWSIPQGPAGNNVYGKREERLFVDCQDWLQKFEVEEEEKRRKAKESGQGDDDDDDPEEVEVDDAACDIPRIPKPGAGDGVWIEPLPISRLNLTKPVHKALRDESFYPQPMGINPQFMNRWMGDRKIFARKKPGPSMPAILLDVSGSMVLPPLTEFLEKFPRAIIACYGGPRPDGGYKGTTLHILAENGKMVAPPDYPMTGGNNCSDGIALRWLAKQPGKKFWISDGHCTGTTKEAMDRALLTGTPRRFPINSYENLKEDAQAVCDAANIKRFMTLERALEFFEEHCR